MYHAGERNRTPPYILNYILPYLLNQHVTDVGRGGILQDCKSSGTYIVIADYQYQRGHSAFMWVCSIGCYASVLSITK